MRTLLPILIVIVFFSNCNKGSVQSDAASDYPSKTPLTGTWELRQTQSQIGVKDYPVGTGSILKFEQMTYTTTDSTYKIFVQGNHAATGYYRIISDTTAQTSTGIVIDPGEYTNRIVLDEDSTSDKIFFQLNDDKLSIISGYFPTDGGSLMIYEKKLTY